MTHAKLTPQPGILDISPYIAGESKTDGANQVTKLSSNENPDGPSPKAIDAFRAAAETLAVYPSSDHTELRAAIGEVLGLDPARIICGAGSDEVIAFLCNAYAGPGTEVVYTEHGFSMYRISALAAGATPVIAAETDLTADIDAILSVVTENTRIVFLANPNNPTGTMISNAEVARLADALPTNCMLVIDSAYAEFVPGYDGGAAIVDAHENVVMTRTFSKIHGLGSLRIGWGYGPAPVIDALNRIRGPFNVSAAALAAAEAAIRDTDYAARCLATNTRWRDWLVAELNALGLPTAASFGNFVLPRFADADAASGCDAYLRQHGFIVRNVAGYGLPEYLRITVGDEVACHRLITLIAEFLEGQT